MRKLLTILILATASISVSYSQDLPPAIKAWCLGINDQNKILKEKDLIKDSIIHLQDNRETLQRERIASYQRDSVSYMKQTTAYREEIGKKDTIQALTNKQLKKTKTLAWGLGVLDVLVIVGSFLVLL